MPVVNPNATEPRLLCIQSGGQTGADRAALDWALDRGFPHSGWCPRGRLAEDGPLPQRYQLQETSSPKYVQRTRLNVEDSDGTVILSLAAELTGGSLLTARMAEKARKPLLHLVAREPGPGQQLRAFVQEHGIGVLNVAGPRESGEPGIYAFVREVLDAAFG